MKGRFYRRSSIGYLTIVLAVLAYAGCGGPRLQIQALPTPAEPSAGMIPASYRLGPGDEVEVLYHIDPGFKVADYVIDTEDTLRIDFYYYPVMSRTVRVRPDGYVTLQRIGDFKAAGLKPRELAEQISRLYQPYLTKPVVTVEMIEFDAKIRELKKAITTQSRGQSRLVVVRPDGRVSLPYIKDTLAAGLTAGQLAEKLTRQYRKFIANIRTSVAVLAAHSNKVYLLGQVTHPNFYSLAGPTTLIQLIATAGGFTREANIHQVVLIRRGANGRPRPYAIDMDNLIGKVDLSADPLLEPFDVIYVPRTKLAEAALVGEALWRLIPLSFVGSASTGYNYGD